MAVDEQEAPRDVCRQQAQALETMAHCGRVGVLGRTETGVAVATEARAQCPAAGARDRAHAGLAFGHHHAYGVLTLALHADLVALVERRNTEQQLAHGREHLAAVDRAAPEFEIDLDVGGNRLGVFERADDVGARVYRVFPVFMAVVEIAQRLQAAGGGTRAEGNDEGAVVADPLNAFDVVGGGDAALDEGDIDLGILSGDPGLEKVPEIHEAGERQQLLADIEERKLAAVAGGELVHGDRIGRLMSVPPSRRAVCGSAGQANTGPSRQTKLAPI